MILSNAFLTFLREALMGLEVNHIFCWIILTLTLSSLIWLLFIYNARSFQPKLILQTLILHPSDNNTSSATVDALNKSEEKARVLKSYTKSLIEDHELEQRIYKRTQPSAGFLSPGTLNQKLFKGYFLAWIPSVLTTMGVLGTFIGLQKGLNGINLDSENVQIMLDGIKILIDGAKTAFNTSIFGVVSGIIFGLSLRFARQRQRDQLLQLTNKLDELISEALPEDDLRHVRESSALSTEQLKALREEIGPRLQETLVQMPELIGAAVGSQIKGAVSSIGEQNAETLGDALKEVYSDHLGSLKGLGDVISQQAENTNQILTKLDSLSKAIEFGSEKLNSSATSLSSVSTQFGKWDESLEDYAITLKDTTNSFTSASETLETVANVLEKTAPKLQSTIGNAAEVSVANQTAIQNNSAKLTESFDKVSSSFTDFESAVETLKDFAPAIEKASELFSSSAEALQDSKETQLESAKSNRAAASEFEKISNHFEIAMKGLEGLGDVSINLGNASETAKESYNNLQAVSLQLNGMLEDLNSISSTFLQVKDAELGKQFSKATENLNLASQQLTHLTGASEKLEVASSNALSLFKEAGEGHTVFINGIATSVGALKEQISILLETYRNNMQEQTVQRIQDWNNSAVNFAVQFQEQVSHLDGSIEELKETLETRNS